MENGGGEICIIKHNQISASNLGQADLQSVPHYSPLPPECCGHGDGEAEPGDQGAEVPRAGQAGQGQHAGPAAVVAGRRGQLQVTAAGGHLAGAGGQPGGGAQLAGPPQQTGHQTCTLTHALIRQSTIYIVDCASRDAAS